jgi:phosphatidylglycerophosphatase A
VPFTWYWVILGFALFRLFDIWKPWPVSYLDRNIKSGFGTMLDDVAAGVFAAIVMQIVLYATST